MFWFDKANRLSAIFFHFGVQIWRFPAVSIAISVLRSITSIALDNLFMHSSLAIGQSETRYFVEYIKMILEARFSKVPYSKSSAAK